MNNSFKNRNIDTFLDKVSERIRPQLKGIIVEVLEELMLSNLDIGNFAINKNHDSNIKPDKNRTRTTEDIFESIRNKS